MLKLIKQSLLILLTCFSLIVSAKQSPLDEYYQDKLIHLNQLLIKNKNALKNNNKKLGAFVDANILPLWSSTTTLKALLGNKAWKSIRANKQVNLTDAFNQTLHRYVREGMKFYDNQKFSFVSTKVNNKGDRGHLTILIEPELLPSISVTFKMIKLDKEWKLYDILIVGISYVKMKKLEIQRLYTDQGIEAVLSLLTSKNTLQNNSAENKNLE